MVADAEQHGRTTSLTTSLCPIPSHVPSEEHLPIQNRVRGAEAGDARADPRRQDLDRCSGDPPVTCRPSRSFAGSQGLRPGDRVSQELWELLTRS